MLFDESTTLESIAIQCMAAQVARNVSRLHIPNINVRPIDLIDFDARVDDLKLLPYMARDIKHAIPYDELHDGNRVKCVGCNRLVTMTCCTSIWRDGRCRHRTTKKMIDHEILKNNKIPSICDSCNAANVEVEGGNHVLSECYEYSATDFTPNGTPGIFKAFVIASNCGLKEPIVQPRKRCRLPSRGRISPLRVLEPF